MINAEGLTTVLAHVREHQDEWRQDEWSNCFAGHTVRLLAGATEIPGCCVACGPQGLTVQGEKVYGYQIGTKARELLGLTLLQADRLFSGCNSLERLAELVEEFTKEDVTPDMALAA